ncbi:DUF1911 domain-containing protein [Duganella sp. BJB1802]|uniref:PoNe immunity protein domain-containing protein n=1 Tax=Duganella sp. BJB1802 TaxID=2744575 RepID=UPI00159462D7|nr:PoNe immunity protein domain-containing protein [Duganella sp. BJB1802]NVD71553.1 DUF1911 domain-containing protein [Duganella sp. BJB1802]
MKTLPFHERRRQQFLYEDLYEKTRENQLALIEGELENKKISNDALDNSSIHQFLHLEAFWIWMLDYTAGVSIDELAPRISGIVDTFETWNEVDQTLQKEATLEFPEYGPYEYQAAPDFSVLFDYENTLQLLSIAILLRDLRSIKRIIHMLRSHCGQDGLFEELIGGYIEDEMTLSSCVLGKPYDILLQVFHEEDDQQALDLVQQYLRQWYPAMKDHPRWYDGHLRIKKQGYAPYYGYWAFEAAATVYLLDLDGSRIDHLVYPQDLVDYARKLREEDRYTGQESETSSHFGRAEGGQPCPRTGFWETPAKLHSRSHFKQGDILPIFDGSEYGGTIWQWSGEH